MTHESDLDLVEEMLDHLDSIPDAAARLEDLAEVANCRLRRKMMDEVNAVRLAVYCLYGVLGPSIAVKSAVVIPNDRLYRPPGPGGWFFMPNTSLEGPTQGIEKKVRKSK